MKESRLYMKLFGALQRCYTSVLQKYIFFVFSNRENRHSSWLVVSWQFGQNCAIVLPDSDLDPTFVHKHQQWLGCFAASYLVTFA